jgi:hypothetical protein
MSPSAEFYQFYNKRIPYLCKKNVNGSLSNQKGTFQRST